MNSHGRRKFTAIRISPLETASHRHQYSSRKEHWCIRKPAYQVCIERVKEEVARLRKDCLAGKPACRIHWARTAPTRDGILGQQFGKQKRIIFPFNKKTLCMKSIFLTRVKTRQKLESEKTRVCAQKPRLKMPFKNSLSGFLMESHCCLMLSCIATFLFCCF